MDISEARAGDISTVLALIGELLVELGPEGQEFARIDRDRLLSQAKDRLPTGKLTALLAWDDAGTAIGVLTLVESFALYAGGDYGTIAEMYVRPDHRDRSTGEALLAEAVAVARRKGWRHLDVTGPQDRSGGRALAFYEKAGFEFAGLRLRLSMDDRSVT
jgi:GNAT superfamily N-acetyltransferase